MKQIYKYLVLTIGTAILPLSVTCQAAQPASAQIVLRSDEDILAIIPKDNPERRNAFLNAVWQRQKSIILSHVECNGIDRLEDWNDQSSDLEDAKYAVQTYIQQQNSGFFHYAVIKQEREYYLSIEQEVEEFKKRIENTKFHEQNKLKPLENLFTVLPQLIIGCPGCALTWDLIMDIIRSVCNRLMKNPHDSQVNEVLQKLCDTINDRLDKDSRSFAHNIPGLPQIVTETVRSMRTQLRSEFTSKDISSLLSLLETSNDFSPFEKLRLRQALNAAREQNPKGISEDGLKKFLRDNTPYDVSRIDSLLKKLDRKISDISTIIETPKAFGGRLAVYSGENGTEAQLPSASKDRATLNEEERTNTRSAMQFWQQRETQ